MDEIHVTYVDGEHADNNDYDDNTDDDHTDDDHDNNNGISGDTDIPVQVMHWSTLVYIQVCINRPLWNIIPII